MHRYKASTQGEHLCQYIHAKLEDTVAWAKLRAVVKPIGNPDAITYYYRFHASVFLTCRLISAATSFVTEDQENLTALTSIVEGFPWSHLNDGNRLVRLLSRASMASGRPIRPSVRSELVAFSKQHHPNCYICGLPLDFADDQSPARFSMDHLWPSAFGGDSEEANLLPACKTCNNKKGSFAAWVSSDVHSLFMRIAPNQNHLYNLPFLHRYALFQRAAISLAVRNNLTLRQAFIRLGPMAPTRIRDTTWPTDMFNVETHQELEGLELI